MEELMKETKAGQTVPTSETEPKKKFGLPKSKKAKIRQLLKEGTSARETALQSDATRRWVIEVAKEMRNDAQQLSLFDT